MFGYVMLDKILNRFGKIFVAEIPIFGAFDTVFGIVKIWEPLYLQHSRLTYGVCKRREINSAPHRCRFNQAVDLTSREESGRGVRSYIYIYIWFILPALYGAPQLLWYILRSDPFYRLLDVFLKIVE